MKPNCPKCNHAQVVKNGFIRGQQRYKCKNCHYQFTTTNLDRGKPLWMKLEAVLLYVSGLSMNAIAQMLDVSAQSILNWIRDFGLANYEKPAPDSVVVVELDEMWHFIGVKKNKVWVWKAYDRDHGRLIDWELGGRNRETLNRLLERLSVWDVTVYCTDNYEVYDQELAPHPSAHHVATKTETKNNVLRTRFAMERNNSDHRHWHGYATQAIGCFRRRSKIISKSLQMLDITIALFAKLRVNGNINLLRNWRLSLLT
ncbi:MAG: IS1 family transposase [Gloeomargarita sp. HHBFW_bins_162]